MHLKIRRLDVESESTLEEGEFKVSFDGCIRVDEWVALIRFLFGMCNY